MMHGWRAQKCSNAFASWTCAISWHSVPKFTEGSVPRQCTDDDPQSRPQNGSNAFHQLYLCRPPAPIKASPDRMQDELKASGISYVKEDTCTTLFDTLRMAINLSTR